MFGNIGSSSHIEIFLLFPKGGKFISIGKCVSFVFLVYSQVWVTMNFMSGERFCSVTRQKRTIFGKKPKG